MKYLDLVNTSHDVSTINHSGGLETLALIEHIGIHRPTTECTIGIAQDSTEKTRNAAKRFLKNYSSGGRYDVLMFPYCEAADDEFLVVPKHKNSNIDLIINRGSGTHFISGDSRGIRLELHGIEYEVVFWQSLMSKDELKVFKKWQSKLKAHKSEASV
ncbi:MAG: hypothetical protein AABW88_01335 [Nanoarchaeota archaeon]